MKTILALFGVLAVLVVVAVAGVAYVSYRVHKRAEEIKQTYHLDQLGGAHEESPDWSAKLPKACSLISKGEIEALTSQPVTNVVDRRTYCHFVAGDADSGVTIEVEGDAQMSMKVIVGGAALAGRALGQSANPMDAIPGIGDEAYYLGGQLYFRKGDVMVTLNTSKPMLSRQTTVSIAQRVASRM